MNLKRIKQCRTAFQMSSPVLRTSRHHLQTTEEHASCDDVRVAHLQQWAEETDRLLVQLQALKGIPNVLLSLHLTSRNGQDRRQQRGEIASQCRELNPEEALGIEHVQLATINTISILNRVKTQPYPWCYLAHVVL